MGVPADGQKVPLRLRALAGPSEAAWRDLLQDLESRGPNRAELLIIDCGKGLEAALAVLWPDSVVQRCTVHKLRNLIAHAPKKLHEELTAEYSAMIYADTPALVLARRRAFLRKWRLRCPRGARSLEEAGSGCSCSCAIRRRSGVPSAQPTPSSGCTRSSSGASRRSACCRARTRPDAMYIRFPEF